jgi:hypothetical protein
MSEHGADSLGMAAARLESAVARLADVLEGALQRRAETPAPEGEAGGDMVPKAELAALAERLDQTITRLRGALAEEMRRAEEE